MLASLPPASILVVGAFLLPLLRGRAQAALRVALPVLSGAHLVTLFGLSGAHQQIEFFHYTLTLARVDRLSLVFGLVFHIAALTSAVFALHVRDTGQHVAGALYAGAAIAGVFAGDLITFFVYWELTAISSVFLVWASRTERSYRSGMRYLVVQVGSGVILLSGILFHLRDTGSVAFGSLDPQSLGGGLILLAFGVKAAFPLLHNWLVDAYPEATPTGAVYLSAFTTKLAIYALARGFAGTDALIWIGAVMAVFPLFLAVFENDFRRVLAYCLVNQLGFMVVGVGIGTELALNGVAAHAFAHILYKSLLFMAMGAVLHRTGSARGSDLGGLRRSMPYTAAFCLVGAAAVSAPLFCGFVSKSIIVSAAAETHHVGAWFALEFATAGVFLVAGLKIPYFTFFARDAGPRTEEAPSNMLVAMAVTAALCTLVGLFPGRLYALLPYRVGYVPYTASHVASSVQMLLAVGVAFAFLVRRRRFPARQASVVLDTDWIYRRLVPRAVAAFLRVWRAGRDLVAATLQTVLARILGGLKRACGPRSLMARDWPIGGSVLWITVLLAAFLIFYYSTTAPGR